MPSLPKLPQNSPSRFLDSQTLIHLVFLFITVCLFWQFLRLYQPGYFFSDDNSNSYLESYTYTYTSIVHHHTLPLVNYHDYLGNVHLGQGVSGVFYPPLYLSFGLAQLLDNTISGLELLILFHWLAAAAGMYLWLKHLTYQSALSALGSFAFLSLPFIAGVSRNWVVLPYLLSYLPWNWWFLDRWLHTHHNRDYLGLTLTKIVLALSGFVQWLFMALFIESLYLIFKKTLRLASITSLRHLTIYLLTWVVAGLIAAPVILPLWHTTQISTTRSGRIPYTLFMETTVSFSDWFQAQIHNFSFGVFNGTTFIYFIGWIWVPIWIWFWANRRRFSKSNQKLWLLLGFTTLTAFLCSTSVYGLFYHLPLFNWFRNPFKYQLVFEFFFISGLILGLAHLIPPRRSQLSFLILIAGIGVNLHVLLNNSGYRTAFSNNRITLPLHVDWLDHLDPLSGRTFTYGIDLNGDEYQSQLLTYKFPSLLGWYGFGGYDTVQAQRLYQAVHGLAEYGSTQTSFDQAAVDYLRSWGVRYWITESPEAATALTQAHPDITTIYSDPQVTVSQDSRPTPFVYWSDTTPADFVFHPNGITVTTHNQSGPLTFNVLYWPQYHAFADGQPLQVTETNFRPTVTAPPGTSIVKLVFVDPHFNLGFIISASTITLIIASYFFHHRLNRG